MKFKPGGGDCLKRKTLNFLLTEEMRKKYGVYVFLLHTFDPAVLFLGTSNKIIMYVRQILIQRNITEIFLLKLKKLDST